MPAPTNALRRFALLCCFAAALVCAQLHESRAPSLDAHLELETEPLMPARVYLFKDGRPFRFSPVQALLPLRVDMFYRERLWYSSPDPDTLEVTCNDESHFVLLKGRARFDLPAGKYRVEAYRGLFFAPVVEEFQLDAGQRRQIRLRLRDWTDGERREWISGDDHIHLTRFRQDNAVFLNWLAAEDLSVGNFLQLQRQSDAAVQYAFGRNGEALRGSTVIRPGHESRCEFYGHVNLLGGRELVGPLSIGRMYANAEEAYPFPGVLFARGRKLGATVGYAHFNGSMPHSTLLMDLALGRIDFVEVFQFGVLKTEAWYELLNAGLKFTGIAGSDFPVPLMRFRPWPRPVPLLGPERTLVKAVPGASPYEAWAAGVRQGNVVVSNGPLLQLSIDRQRLRASATVRFFQPIESLEIIRNGRVIGASRGDRKRSSDRLEIGFDSSESCWLAARAKAYKNGDGPQLQAHTNPQFVLREGKPALVAADRAKVASEWESELKWYRSAALPFANSSEREEFFRDGERALEKLRRQ